VTARLFGETKTEPVPGVGDQEDDLTGAVLTTFAGSRVTLSRLRDRAHEKVGGDPVEPPPG
jgi:hypothetical protein